MRTDVPLPVLGFLIPWRTTEMMTLGASTGTAAQEPSPLQGEGGELFFFLMEFNGI